MLNISGRNGSLNIADVPVHDVAEKNVIYFRETTGDLLEELERLRVSPTVVKFATRFVIVSDYMEMIAYANSGLMEDTKQLHGLNVFFTRLLFCYFAEETVIFGKPNSPTQ